MTKNRYPNLEKYLDSPDRETYPQICSWLGTVVLTNEPKPWTVEQFEDAVWEMGYRVKYITEYRVSGGSRVDLLFALHQDDVNEMIGDRFTKFDGEIKWFEDYRMNYKSEIPSKILKSIPDVWQYNA